MEILEKHIGKLLFDVKERDRKIVLLYMRGKTMEEIGTELGGIKKQWISHVIIDVTTKLYNEDAMIRGISDKVFMRNDEEHIYIDCKAISKRYASLFSMIARHVFKLNITKFDLVTSDTLSVSGFAGKVKANGFPIALKNEQLLPRITMFRFYYTLFPDDWITDNQERIIGGKKIGLIPNFCLWIHEEPKPGIWELFRLFREYAGEYLEAIGLATVSDLIQWFQRMRYRTKETACPVEVIELQEPIEIDGIKVKKIYEWEYIPKKKAFEQIENIKKMIEEDIAKG